MPKTGMGSMHARAESDRAARRDANHRKDEPLVTTGGFQSGYEGPDRRHRDQLFNGADRRGSAR